MTAFTPYGSISLEATPSGNIGKFTDPMSIGAETVRIYNSGTVEVFVGFSKTASVPNKEEVSNSFCVPPKTSETLYKGSGNDQVSAITSGGISQVRATAVKLNNSGGDLMSSLELVSVLKDAMGSQKAINAAIEKIASSNTISEQRKKEAQDAARVIAEAKIAAESLNKEKVAHAEKVKSHEDNVMEFNKKIEEEKANIAKEKAEAKTAFHAQLSSIAKAQEEVSTIHAMAEKRESVAIEKEKSNLAFETALTAIRATNEAEKQRIIDAKAAHEKDVADFIAYKTNLENALKGK